MASSHSQFSITGYSAVHDSTIELHVGLELAYECRPKTSLTAFVDLTRTEVATPFVNSTAVDVHLLGLGCSHGL